MPLFSANLGFLWRNLELPDAVKAAGNACFDAVECHWPYATPPDTMRAALDASGLSLLALNTARGDVDKGDFGLSALPGRRAEALSAIDAAVEYADAVEAEAIHVLSGKEEGAEAENMFRENLAYACEKAGARTILIEPINAYDVPGYFLRSTTHARRIIDDLDAPNLKLMFDCYHVARSEGDVLLRLKELLPYIGHIQIAAVPDRGAPDHGSLDYDGVFREIDALGWNRPIGAEYRPNGPTEASLGWMAQAR